MAGRARKSRFYVRGWLGGYTRPVDKERTITEPKGLWRDPRSGIFCLRRSIPPPLQSAFACGQLYKVSLGTADPRDGK
ncbi:DUF6538 domain-containing protein [Sphingopyxis sp. NFH-91]|uniref:DUF6538 domain-containing protein n=1 Tax=Sphingopyxis sp. NFH-91 TaxID=2744457 RepID=UPI003FA397EF